jgi:hypothetical protein
VPAVAAGQTEVNSTSGASASFRAAVTSDDTHTGGAWGGSFSVGVFDRTALELEGLALDRGHAVEALLLGAAFRIDLSRSPSTAAVAPYVLAGAGLYRARFDLGDARFLGQMDHNVPPGARFCAAPGRGGPMGPGMGYGAGDCPLGSEANRWGVGALSDFYGRRLGVLEATSGLTWGHRTFNDLAMQLGGGVAITRARITVRPDARLLLVVGDGRVHPVGVFGASIGYRF